MSDPVRLPLSEIRAFLIAHYQITPMHLQTPAWTAQIEREQKLIEAAYPVLIRQIRACQTRVAVYEKYCRLVDLQAAAFELDDRESRSPDGDGQQGQLSHAKDSVSVTDAVAATALPRQREAGSNPADSLQSKLEAAEAALTALRRERDEARERVFAIDRARAEIQNRYAVMEARLYQTQTAQHELYGQLARAETLQHAVDAEICSCSCAAFCDGKPPRPRSANSPTPQK